MSTETIVAEMRAEADEFRKAANYPKTEYGIGAAGAACIIAEAIEGWADRLEALEAVAWECVSRDGSCRDVVGTERERETYARMGRTITPLVYAAAQRQEQEGGSHG